MVYAIVGNYRFFFDHQIKQLRVSIDPINMTTTDRVEQLLSSLGFSLPENVKRDIECNLRTNHYNNKHCSFILDLKTRRILSYSFNIFFKSDSFPFSIHAEIQSIVKYYKSKSINKNKKALIVFKLSRTGLIGNSKCCLNCIRFIKNNMSNLNLKKIYYSTLDNQLVELVRDGMDDENFKYSKGYLWRQG